MKKVTVVLPVHNGQAHLARALDCLAMQSFFSELEIIVVNDGSTDATQHIINAYKRVYPKAIRAVRCNKQRGLAHARNAALTAATGEYITFINPDDVFDFTLYQKLYEYAQAQQADICVCGYYLVNGYDMRPCEVESQPCFGYSLKEVPSLLRCNTPYLYNKLFKTAMVKEAYLRFEEDLSRYSSVAFTYAALLHANKVVHVPEALYSYRVAGDGLPPLEFSENQTTLFSAYSRLLEYYKQHFSLPLAQEDLLYALLVLFYDALDLPASTTQARDAKQRFYKRGVRFLDKHFRGWRNREAYFNDHNKSAGWLANNTYMQLYTGLGSKVGSYVKRHTIERAAESRKPAGVYFTEALEQGPASASQIMIDSYHGVAMDRGLLRVVQELLRSSIYARESIVIPYVQEAQKTRLAEAIEAFGMGLNRIRFVEYESEQYIEALAASSYVFSNVAMPAYYVKPAGQVYVHVMDETPYRKVGRDITEAPYYDGALAKTYLMADYVACQSGYVNELMERAYGIHGLTSNTVLFSGNPRNQIFFDVYSRFEVRKRFGAHDMQVVAFVPEWPWNVQSNEDIEAFISFLCRVDAWLTESQVLLVDVPSASAARLPFDQFKRIKPFPQGVGVYEVLNAADVLITDWSSVIFDYGVTRRKIIFLRGFGPQVSAVDAYFDPDYVGLPVVYSAEELIAELRRGVNEQAAHTFAEMYCGYDSERSAAVICQTAKYGPGPLTMVRMPQSQAGEATLVFTGSFASPAVEGAVLNAVLREGFDQRVVLSFNQDTLRNKELLRELGPNVSWMGVQPFAATTESQQRLLAALNTFTARGHRKEYEAIAAREWQRAYPTLEFGNTIVYGSDSPANMLLAACAPGYSTLVLVGDENDAVAQLPAWLLGKFDAIYGTDASVSKLPAGVRTARICSAAELEVLPFEGRLPAAVDGEDALLAEGVAGAAPAEPEYEVDPVLDDEAVGLAGELADEIDPALEDDVPVEPAKGDALVGLAEGDALVGGASAELAESDALVGEALVGDELAGDALVGDALAAGNALVGLDAQAESDALAESIAFAEGDALIGPDAPARGMGKPRK